MRPFTARRLALAAFVPVLLVLSVVPGCSNQSEGERCTDDADCDSALTCTLIDPAASISRCCYGNGRVTDSRCANTTSTSATGNAGGSGKAGASSGGGGASGDAGAASSEAGLGGDVSLPAGAGGI